MYLCQIAFVPIDRYMWWLALRRAIRALTSGSGRRNGGAGAHKVGSTVVPVVLRVGDCWWCWVVGGGAGGIPVMVMVSLLAWSALNSDRRTDGGDNFLRIKIVSYWYWTLVILTLPTPNSSTWNLSPGCFNVHYAIFNTVVLWVCLPISLIRRYSTVSARSGCLPYVVATRTKVVGSKNNSYIETRAASWLAVVNATNQVCS